MSTTEVLQRVNLLLPETVSVDVIEAVLTTFTVMYGGVTFSQFPSPIFSGQWFSGGRIWPKEGMLLIMCDVPHLSIEELLPILGALKKSLERRLNEDLVWLTVQTIWRVTDNDNWKEVPRPTITPPGSPLVS